LAFLLLLIFCIRHPSGVSLAWSPLQAAGRGRTLACHSEKLIIGVLSPINALNLRHRIEPFIRARNASSGPQISFGKDARILRRLSFHAAVYRVFPVRKVTAEKTVAPRCISSHGRRLIFAQN
jgi:hypothetical protein